MYDTTAGYRAQIRQSHTVRAEADLLIGGIPYAPLLVLDGTVTWDRDAEIRGSCTLSVRDPTGTLTPASSIDALGSFGAELALRRGIRLADGTLELVPLGIYGIDTLDVTDTPEGPALTITGYDRAQQIARNTWPDTWIINAGAQIPQAIHDLIDDRRPGLTYNLAASDHLTHRTILGDTRAGTTSPWADAHRLATAAGHDLYFDRNGTCTTAPIAANTTITEELHEGVDCTITSLARNFTSDGAYNGVIAIGENSDGPPVRAAVWDEDPASPTYHAGPFGKRPYTHTSPKIRTQAQAETVARLLLRRFLGRADTITITTTPDPARDVDDLITLARAPIKLSGTYRISALSTPLKYSETQSLTARRETIRP